MTNITNNQNISIMEYNLIAQEKDYTLLAEKGFFGVDASLEESLEEYNLALAYNSGWGDIGNCTVLYRSGGIWKQTNIDGAKICTVVNESWVDKKAFYSFIGINESQWLLMPLVHQLHNLILFCGVDNIL